MKRLHRILLIPLPSAMLLLSGTGLAQEASDTAEEPTTTLETIVVTAMPLRGTAESLAHPVELEKLFLFKSVEIGHTIDQPEAEQLINQPISQPLDVHCPAGTEMFQRLLQLRWTTQPLAAGDNLTFSSGDRRTAGGALFRLRNLSFTAIAFFRDDFNDIGNDVASPFDHDGITDPDTEPFDFVPVV